MRNYDRWGELRKGRRKAMDNGEESSAIYAQSWWEKKIERWLAARLPLQSKHGRFFSMLLR
jgi:hypothetical protein